MKFEIERQIAGIYKHDMFQEELKHKYYNCTTHKIKEESAINFFVKHCSFKKDVS